MLWLEWLESSSLALKVPGSNTACTLDFPKGCLCSPSREWLPNTQRPDSLQSGEAEDTNEVEFGPSLLHHWHGISQKPQDSCWRCDCCLLFSGSSWPNGILHYWLRDCPTSGWKRGCAKKNAGTSTREKGCGILCSRIRPHAAVQVSEEMIWQCYQVVKEWWGFWYLWFWRFVLPPLRLGSQWCNFWSRHKALVVGRVDIVSRSWQ